MRTTVFFGILFPLLSGLTQRLAYGEPASPEGRPIFRVDTNLVLVPVTVTNSRGGVVPNLNRSNFTLTEEKVRQEIISFTHETAPASLGLVVDVSGSMRYKIAEVQAAVEALLQNLEPKDEAFLVTFADRPELRLPFTSDTSAIRAALSFARPRGWTALFDGVALAVQQMRKAQNRIRVLFLISDGGDNYSRLTKRELGSLLEEEDVQIHAIGIHDLAARGEQFESPLILEELAKMTGGQYHKTDHIDELPALAARMSLAVHDRYLLGYIPTLLGASGTFRRIDVKLVLPKRPRKLYVYGRHGYWMP